MLLGACEQGWPGATSPAPGEDSIDPATGTRRMVMQRKDGPVTVVAGAKVPVTLPPGFTLFEGAAVTANAIAESARGRGVMLAFETGAGAGAVADHYRTQAEAAGFVVVAALDTEGRRTLAATRAKDRATFSLDAAEGPPTSVQLSISTGSPR